MAAPRVLLALLALAVVATTAAGAPAAPTAPPSGLHGFLFRADEPVRREFVRTPSFAWKPVSGAVRYEFELATSNTFRDNGLVFAERNLTSPVASVSLTLPWITGSPYSLFARVRAIMRGGPTAWSAPWGFNMRQATIPKPLASFPGVLRWTPVDGASAYEVWLLDVNKKLVVYGNVLDQRELYTLHQGDAWISKLRWRIRTLRWDITGEANAGRTNGLPAAKAGPWSPAYESGNPSFATGPLRLVATISDVVARGAHTDPAHRIMPAFVFAGNEALDGKQAEFFRVYVFTDRDCVNRVFTGSIVGSPSFAGRSSGGPLELPRSTADLAAKRAEYLRDGGAGAEYAQDGEPLTPNESLPSTTPTTGLPGAAATTPAPGGGGTPAPGGAGSVNFLDVVSHSRAPVDLWDANWPEGGYYWTAVAVEAAAPTTQATSTAVAAAIGDATLTVVSGAGFATGDVISVGNPSNQETVTVTSVAGNVLTLATALKQGHGSGEPVSRSAGNLTYRDLELPQEVCAAGRVMRFGKSSEPTLVAAGTPFASGLSPRGRLTSATPGAASFYGAPLVAWTPAFGADAYHVQWSKTRSPFRPVEIGWQGRAATAGILTWATSAVLPLQPGRWWYRVRGVGFSLPTNAQFMGWSDPTRLVVAKPTFAVAKKPKK